MVVKGRARAGAAELAAHLRRVDTNERMELVEVVGTVAGDLPGALREMEAVAAGTRCRRPLYHASINVRVDEPMAPEQWRRAVECLGERLALADQPRVVVLHEKHGRTHLHVVWSRIKASRMAAIHDGHNFRAHEEVARALEAEFGHARVQGAHVGREKAADPRPARAPYPWETQQRAKTRGPAIADVAADATAAWRDADGGLAFRTAVEARGYLLARGDRRDLVLVDRAGGVHGLARRIEGARAREVRERLADLDPALLPGVTEARAAQATRAAEAPPPDAHAMLDRLLHGRSWFTEAELQAALRTEGVPDVGRAAASVLAHEGVLALHERDGFGGHGIVGYTTRAVRAQEAAVVERAARLAARVGGHVPEARIAPAVRETGLDVEQAAALRHALAPGDLKAIEGRAGTGKSHLLKGLRTAAEASGHPVLGLAPTNVVAQDLRDGGFAQATTVHSLLWFRDHAPGHERARIEAGTLLVVDEAAMLSTAVLDRLTAAAEASGAKLVLVGDDRQLGSVERGGVFTDIVARVGSARLETVRRQEQDWARAASRDLTEGRFEAGLRAYAERGLVDWSDDLDGARQRLVEQWAADTEAGRGRRLVFAYTNEEVDQLNAALQAVEVARGRVRGLREVETARGTIRVGEGDRVAFRGTDKRAGINAGALGTVEAIEGPVLTVRSDAGRRIRVDTAEFRDIGLGYAGTIHRGQGKTLDATYLLHTRHWRDAASYVALTRARKDSRLFVARTEANDLRDLARQMVRQQNRGSTLGYGVAPATSHAASPPTAGAASASREQVAAPRQRRGGASRTEQEFE
jgi:hypothetical protein